MDAGSEKKGVPVRRFRPIRCWLGLLVLLCFSDAEREALARHQFARGSESPERQPALDVHVKDLRLPRQPIDKYLSDGQVHSYAVELPAGGFLRVDFFSSSLDLLVSLAGPRGQKSLEWSIPKRVPTPISTIVDVHGTYELKVRSLENEEDLGVYRVEAKALRHATPQDQKQVGACRALSDAAELRKQWTQKSLNNAISRYERALSYWQAMDRPLEAAILKNIGDIWEILCEQQKALACLRKAGALYRELKDQTGEVKIVNAISASYIYRGEFQKALEIYTQEPAGIADPWEKAQAVHNFGAAYYGRNEMEKAKGLLNEALHLREAIIDRSGQAESLLYLGYVRHAMKDTSEAERFYQQSLELWRAARNPRGQALTLTALGHLSSISGQRQRALDYYDESIKIFQTIGELVGQSSVLEGKAYLYSALGEREKALQYYLEALGLFRRAKDVIGEGNTLDYISEIYRDLGDYSTAIEYSQEAVLIQRSLPSILGEAYALANEGKAFEALGNTNGAMEDYTRALELSRKGGDPFLEGLLLNALGHLHHASRQISKALDYYQQAFSLQQKVNDSVRLPGTLYNLARAERDQGDLDRSIQYCEQALKIIESLRGKVASQKLRGSFLASVHQQYELTIDLLMQQDKQRPSEGFQAAGLKASESARSRGLLDLLTEAHLDIRQGISSDLLERERSLQRLLNAKAERQTRLLSGKHEEKEFVALTKEISQITSEYEQLQGQIRSKSPRYAALMQPQPLDLKEIQQQVLDDDTLLLEYSLGDERSYLWAVTPTTMTSHELPRRVEIEKAARQVYDLLVAHQPNTGETAQQYRGRVAQTDAEYCQKAASLSEMLLGPVADQLGSKRLLIVAEGALQYLPFEALPKPTPQGERGKAKGEGEWSEGESKLTPLLLDHEVVSLPSASVMAVLRRETKQRQAPSKMVAVLADPVFEHDDPRLRGEGTRQHHPVTAQPAKGQNTNLSSFGAPTATSAPSTFSSSLRRRSTTPPSPLTDMQRAVRDVGISRDGLSVPRLLSTRREAEAIISVAPAGAALKAVDFQASRVTATSPELGQYRIVHFATHGLMNNEHPELSGLVLSLVDEQGKPQDGFLRLHDIYNLNLPADLVVLSACNTGLGKEVKGEGLIGIVRGFMYAGAARVVASLWKVDDEATAELMKRFYRRMLQDNMPAAAALRAAQVEMWQQKQWRSPYYWASFVLQGEWK